MVRRTLAQRVMGKFLVGDDCWEWTAAASRGYGVIAAGGRGEKLLKAHRAVWEVFNGPIPSGLIVCHHCDNRKCVRLDHLFLGTQSDNLTDAIKKGKRWGQNRGKFSLEEREAIRERVRSGERQIDVARDVGLHPSCISRLMNGRRRRVPA